MALTKEDFDLAKIVVLNFQYEMSGDDDWVISSMLSLLDDLKDKLDEPN